MVHSPTAEYAVGELKKINRFFLKNFPQHEKTGIMRTSKRTQLKRIFKSVSGNKKNVVETQKVVKMVVPFP